MSSLGSGKFTLGLLRKMALKKLPKNLKMAFGKMVVPLFGENGQFWGRLEMIPQESHDIKKSSLGS